MRRQCPFFHELSANEGLALLINAKPANTTANGRTCARPLIIHPLGKMAERWMAIYGSPPPRGVKRGLLERACTYHLQVKAFGALNPSTRKALLRLGNNARAGKSGARKAIKAGTRLIREWNGKVHEVDVGDGHFSWNGRSFRSLSAIAKAITGANWSGPRFFGL